ncbi:MAG: uracil-DNA glycosylase family protein [Lautropia sp.]
MASPAPDTPAGPARALIEAARVLAGEVGSLRFGEPVAHVYNPLDYASRSHEAYLRRYGDSTKRFVMLGMNPGPYGMMQTGVPFGEVAAVRDWMGIDAPVDPPASQHPKRPIQGFDCPRSEVSGRRVWAWARLRYGSADAFFEQAFVLNYCPLVFLEASGRNRTPEQLPRHELKPLQAACDRHLAACVAALRPQWLVGVGGFAEKRLRALVEGDLLDGAVARDLRVGQILHPSPASPAANRGWADAVDARMTEYGLIAPLSSKG